jgi:hypothetical protein
VVVEETNLEVGERGSERLMRCASSVPEEGTPKRMAF